MKFIKPIDFLNSNIRKFLAKGSSGWKEKGPWRLPSVCYTLEHKMALMEREHYLTGHYSIRGLFHDWEKPFLFICPWLDSGKAHKIHVSISAHHFESAKTSSIEDLFEMYFDWDCAAITKPDKPLDAFGTLVHFYPNRMRLMLPLCLMFDSFAVRPDIYIHSWHKLASDQKHNEQIYQEVSEIVLEIIQQFSDLIGALEQSKNKRITECNPTEIFILALHKQAKNYGTKLDEGKTRQILIQLYEKLCCNKSFIHTCPGEYKHDYKEIAPFLYGKD